MEIANEPGHSTQDRRLHDPAQVQRLADLLPEPLIVALGSAEVPTRSTWRPTTPPFIFRESRSGGTCSRSPRAAGCWRERENPVINDEPIGAAAEYQPGRRDNSLERFGAAGALGQFIGMGATFHYEGGLQARVPDGREAACLDAWQRGLELTQDVAVGEWLGRDAVPVRFAKVSGGRQAFGRLTADRAVVLIIDPTRESDESDESGRWIRRRRRRSSGTKGGSRSDALRRPAHCSSQPPGAAELLDVERAAERLRPWPVGQPDVPVDRAGNRCGLVAAAADGRAEIGEVGFGV